MSDRLELLRGVVHPWHCDHFGHMNVRHYSPFFDDAVYHFWSRVGVPYARMQDDHGVHCVTARAETRFLRELVAGDLVVVDGAPSRLGTKSVTLDLALRHADTGTPHAACEVVEVFFDPAARASAPMPQAVRAAIAPLLAHPAV